MIKNNSGETPEDLRTERLEIMAARRKLVCDKMCGLQLTLLIFLKKLKNINKMTRKV